MPPNDPNDYTTMQQQAGIMPPGFISPPPTMMPGQVSAQMAMGGGGFLPPMMAMGGMGGMGGMGMGGYGGMGGMGMGGGFGGGMFPSQQFQTFTGGPLLTQGPTGIMMPMPAAAPYNPYAMGGMGPMAHQAPSLYSPQMPMAPPSYAGPQGRVPFGPPPPAPSFETPYQWDVMQQQATHARAAQMGMTGGGIAARMGANLGMGVIGGMAGGPIGALAGFAGSEMLGLGRGAQNMFMNNVMAPFINQRAYGEGIQGASQSFISGGPFMHPSGMGFSEQASQRAGGLMEQMAGSSSFRRETFDRFNTADVMRMGQLGSQQGLMAGVGSPEQMRDKVRDIAKSVNAFMELANEPDLQRAIQTMGQMRQSGLNLPETMQAVQHGRSFARLAGTTFDQLAGIGGAIGSQTYQSMGLTQGLGFRTGMGNMGMAQAGINSGTLSPQLGSLVGGAQGLAGLNTMFSGSFLQNPMLAPAMMTAGGGINANAMQQFMSGGTGIMGMPGQGANNLGAMTGRMGPQGLGMAIAMQPMLQDTIGRMMEAQGPFARRNLEDTSVMQLARQMGMRGASGVLSAAQFMGMDRNQALTRVTEMGDPNYWRRQRGQIEINRRERRAEEIRGNEAAEPGIMDQLGRESSDIRQLQRLGGEPGRWLRNIGETGTGAFTPTSSQMMRENRDYLRTGEAAGFRREIGSRAERIRAGGDEGSWAARFTTDRQIAAARGGGDIMQLAYALTPHDAGDRRREIEGYQQTGRIAQYTMQTTEAQATRLQRQNMERTFGTDARGRAAFAGFAQDVAGTLGGGAPGSSTAGNLALNIAGRGAAMMIPGTMGMIDPGNLVQPGMSDPNRIRESMIGRLTQAGRTREEAEQVWHRQGREVLQMTSSTAQLFMDPTERARANRQATQGGAMGRPEMGSYRAAQETEEQAWVGLLGERSGRDAAGRRAFMNVIEGQREVGRTPEQRKKARDIGATMILLRAAADHGNPEERRNANRQMSEMVQHLNSREGGFNPDEIQQITSNVNREANSGRLQGGDVGRIGIDFLRRHGHKTGREMGEAVGRGTGMGAVASDMQQQAVGLQVLAGSEMGRLMHLGDINLENASPELLRQQMGLMSRTEIAELRGKGPAGARLARIAEGGDVEALGRVASGMGEGRIAAARSAYRNVNRVSRAIGSLFGFDENEYVRRHAAERGTRADEAAAGETGGSIAAEEQALGAGVGTANDQLLSAARELRQAAQALQSPALMNSLENAGTAPQGM